jgi:hypothetical protein
MSLKISDNTNDDDDNDEIIKDRSLTNEAYRVVNEIKFGVNESFVSTKLLNNSSIAFINIRTLEKEDWCIELTSSGYTVVSNCFDSIANNESSETFETVEALMNRISPQYVKIFNEKVAEKLNKLI